MKTFMEDLLDIKEDLISTVAETFKISPENINANRINEGNMNYVFKFSSDEIINSMVIKKSVNYIPCLGKNYYLSSDRILVEIEFYNFLNKHLQMFSPKIFKYSKLNKYIIMEYLHEHETLTRLSLKTDRINFGKIGQFLAHMIFLTEDKYGKCKLMDQQQKVFQDNNLKNLHIDYIFNYPYEEHVTNNYGLHLVKEVELIQNNKYLLDEIKKLKAKYIHDTDSLIHGDFHLGSVMSNLNDSIKIIDHEFCCFGPSSFDIGVFIAHIIVILVVPGQDQLKVLEFLNDFWNGFKYQFSTLVDNLKTSSELQQYFDKLWFESIKFCGCEIIRRIIGASNFPVFNFTDVKMKESELILIKFGQDLLQNTKSYQLPVDLVNGVKF